VNNESPATKDEIIRECSKPDRRNYVCLLMRPGFYSWMVELEYTKFTPDTDANDGFHLFWCKWPEDDPVPQLTMGVVSIDKSGQEYAEAILWQHGLKKCAAGTVFTVLGGSSPQQFFVHGPNTFPLENHSKGAENVVYTNDPVKIKAARAHEMAIAQRFFDEHAQWLETPEGKAIANAYWKKHPTGRVF